MSDVKDDQIPVLFHIANRCPPVIFVPDMGLKRMKITSWCAKLLETDMIRPIEHTGKTQLFLHGYESELVRTVLSSTMYEAVKPGHYFHICDAETFFIMMMTYQEQHGVEKGRKMLQEQYKKEFKTESV
jgi:hypothetical protein